MMNDFSSTQGTVYPAMAEDHAEDGWLVTLRDWPEVAAGGHSFDAAVRDAVDALEEAALHRAAHGEPIPVPSKRKKGETGIGLTPLAVIKLALNTWALERGRGAQTELARRLDWDTRAVRDVLAFKKGKVSTDRMVTAAAAAGFTVQTSLHITGHGRQMGAPGPQGRPARGGASTSARPTNDTR